MITTQIKDDDLDILSSNLESCIELLKDDMLTGKEEALVKAYLHLAEAIKDGVVAMGSMVMIDGTGYLVKDGEE